MPHYTSIKSEQPVFTKAYIPLTQSWASIQVYKPSKPSGDDDIAAKTESS